MGRVVRPAPQEAFYDKRIPLFSTVLSDENRGIFFVDNCCRKSSVRFGTGDPSHTIYVSAPKFSKIDWADIKSAQYKIRFSP